MAGRTVERGKARAHVRNTSKSSIVETPKGKGKGAITDGAVDTEEEDQEIEEQDQAMVQQDLGPLVVLACRHIYHQSCLEAMQVDAASDRDFRCPIDG